MRYLVTTEALMSGIRVMTSAGPGLDRAKHGLIDNGASACLDIRA
jgi:hypothetical protein